MRHETPRPEALLQEVVDLHVAEAARSPQLAQAILERLRHILTRFTHFYRRLRRQPRRTRRTLKAKLATTLAGAALLLALSSTPAMAATINVDGTVCTLVDAITAAETDTATGGCDAGSGADVLELAANATFTLSVADNFAFGPSGTPLIDSEITINGNGATIERDLTAQETFRIFTVGPQGDLTLNNATVTGGDTGGRFGPSGGGGGVANFYGQLAINDSVITGNVASGFGGGVFNYGGNASIDNTEVSNNLAKYLGGGVASGAYGSAGPQRGVKYASLDVTDSTITGNSVTYAGRFGGGGGVANFGVYGGASSMTVTTTTITGNDILDNPVANNVGPFPSASWEGASMRDRAEWAPDGSASGFGGGVHTLSLGYGSADSEINESTISGNFANIGAGVNTLSFKYGAATTTVNRSTLSGNSGGFGGGGLTQANIYSYYALPYGSTVVNNSTISGNSAYLGGGVLSYNVYTGGPDRATIAGNGGLLEIALNDTTISNNSAYVGGGQYNYYATAAVNRTIIAGNSADNVPEAWSFGSTPSTDNYNLFGVDGTDGLDGLFAAGATDIVPGAGVLIGSIVDPLGGYGGPTETHLLPTGSLAIDGVPTAACGPTIDQRGEARPAIDGCDIGSVEVQAPTDVSLTGFGGEANGGGALAGLLTAGLSALGLAGWLTRRRRPIKVE